VGPGLRRDDGVAEAPWLPDASWCNDASPVMAWVVATQVYVGSMVTTSDLAQIRFAILDQLRAKFCRDRACDVEVYQADCECGWSARLIGDLSNDERRDFIAARFAIQRRIAFSPT
jgi:hypothetical protein